MVVSHKEIEIPRERFLGTMYLQLAPPAPQIYSLLKSGAAARFYFHCLLYISAQSSGRRPQYGWALQYPQCL